MHSGFVCKLNKGLLVLDNVNFELEKVNYTTETLCCTLLVLRHISTEHLQPKQGVSNFEVLCKEHSRLLSAWNQHSFKADVCTFVRKNDRQLYTRQVNASMWTKPFNISLFSERDSPMNLI